MGRNGLKNKYTKWPSRENLLTFRKSRKICNNLRKKAKNPFFEKSTVNRLMESKNFWDTVKPFLTTIDFMPKENIAIKVKEKYITKENELTKTFNSHYINIVKNTTGKMPVK